MAEAKRSVRVAEEVQEELSRLLSRKVRDPRVSGVVITRVELSDDLRNARAYYRLLTAERGGSKDVQTGLTRATGLLRKEIAKALKLRVVPEIIFFYDDGLDRRLRVETLLNEITEEQKAKKKKKAAEKPE